MQLTITLPEDLGRRVRKLPDPETFIARVLAKALEGRAQEAGPSPYRRSRWARLVERIEADPVHLDGYGAQLKSDMREFREGFEFKHDR